jgi:5-methylcytosine-specific restriction endonuclease McrA
MAEAQHSAKTCSVCGETKPREAFRKKGAQCKPCLSARQVVANRRRILALRETPEGRDRIRRNKRNYRARLVERGLTIRGTPRKPKPVKVDRQPKAPKERRPWHGLSDTESYRVRYRLDPEYARRERERISNRRFVDPAYGAQWERCGNRWIRALGGSDGTVTRDLIRALRNESHCAYCMGIIRSGGKHIDHVWPLAKGGTHSADNLVTSCDRCNRTKRDKMPLQWLLQCIAGPC